MADLINVRPRPGVRINLHAADIVNVCKQPEVLAAMTEGELNDLVETMMSEINYRVNQKDNNHVDNAS